MTKRAGRGKALGVYFNICSRFYDVTYIFLLDVPLAHPLKCMDAKNKLVVAHAFPSIT